MTTTHRKQAAGFTLIELLVVVAIIALLISILLPSLGKARNMAKTAKCGANIRALAQAHSVYSSQWDGAIAGGAATTGRIYFKDIGTATVNPSWSSVNPPPIFQVADWWSPVAELMNMQINFPTGNSQDQNRSLRFETYRRAKIFTCPSNDFTSDTFSGSTPKAQTGPMPSYNMALLFTMTSGGPATGSLVSPDNRDYKYGYRPNVRLVGNPSGKIAVADGARYSSYQVLPDTDLSVDGAYGGAAQDYGAFTSFSKSYDRSWSPGASGNIPNGNDARLYAFRHGTGTAKGSAGNFKLNVGFFDGHVDTMTESQVIDPALWAPANTTIFSTQLWNDVKTKYAGGQTSYMVH